MIIPFNPPSYSIMQYEMQYEDDFNSMVTFYNGIVRKYKHQPGRIFDWFISLGSRKLQEINLQTHTDDAYINGIVYDRIFVSYRDNTYGSLILSRRTAPGYAPRYWINDGSDEV